MHSVLLLSLLVLIAAAGGALRVEEILVDDPWISANIQQQQQQFKRNMENIIHSVSMFCQNVFATFNWCEND